MAGKKVNVKNVNDSINKSFFYSLMFIKKNRIYFFVPLALLAVSAIFGYFNFLEIIFPNLSNVLNLIVQKSIEQISQETMGLGPLELTGFIIFNNMKTALVGMMSGIYLGIYPILIILFNGYVIGFVGEKAVSNPLNNEGIFILWRLLPHGIFEIPAILISIGLGIKAGLFPFRVRNRGKGILSMASMILLFFFLSSILMFLMFNGADSAANSSFSNPSYLDNPVISLIFYALVLACITLSVFVGLLILDKRDRKSVYNTIKDCFRVFIFVVIPLLIIAGIIEGLLIWIVG